MNKHNKVKMIVFKYLIFLLLVMFLFAPLVAKADGMGDMAGVALFLIIVLIGVFTIITFITFEIAKRTKNDSLLSLSRGILILIFIIVLIFSLPILFK